MIFTDRMRRFVRSVGFSRKEKKIMQTKSKDKVRKLVECAVMIALASALSLFPLMQMPYGGSVTLASMLPIIIIAYRNGIGWGLGSGFAFAFIQQMLGLNNLSYVSTWQSIVAVILLDYALAFVVLGLGGIFKGKLGGQNRELLFGTLLVCIIRYICHVISGATVWAGISIPTTAAMIYSIGYNATYMIPETIVTAVVAYYIGSMIDFRSVKLARITAAEEKAKLPTYCEVLRIASVTVTVAATVYDALAIFAHLQDAESGEFTFTHLGDVAWTPVIIVSTVAAMMLIVSFAVTSVAKKKSNTAGA